MLKPSRGGAGADQEGWVLVGGGALDHEHL